MSSRTRPQLARVLRRLLGALAALAATAVALGVGPVAAPAGADPVVPGVFVVDPAGDDGASGSALDPWRTIAHATRAAPPASLILVRSGSYGPFEIWEPGQVVKAAPGADVVVRGRAGVRDVILVGASNATVAGLRVEGCVPNPEPAGSFEDAGSSTVRIDDGAVGVTLAGLTIRGRTHTNQHGLPFGCYGVLAHEADAFRIVDNDIAGTGAGVYVNGGGLNAIVATNRIHDLPAIIRNTPRADDDFGGTAVTFADVDAVPGVLATGNQVWGNAGPSADYGVDGGGFEIYNASNTQIVGNTIRDNVNVVETGTSPGGTCTGNVFTGNQATGRGPDSRLPYAVGMILRCATAMVIDHNTFTGLDWWAYELTTGDRFSTDVRGLVLTGNTHRQQDRVYRLAIDPAASALVVEGNRFPEVGSSFASYGDGTTSRTLADWQARTGLDRVSPQG